MTPERWQQIEKLCYEALELDSGRREAFLDHICASDEALGEEVRSMLAAHDRAGDFLQQNAMELEAEALAMEKTLALPVQEFSHYRITSRIGAGGMGEVWLARDTKLDRNVALKFLPVQFTSDRDRLQRFVREARAASALNHPNIITIHEIGEAETAQGKVHFIATEFIEGQTLRQVLAHEDLTLKKALDIAIQSAAALDAAHHAGIIHRDIKPENIMVRPDGLVKVLDFGLAKLDVRRSLPEELVDTAAQTQPGIVKTQPGMILGTLRYMSPEQARGREVDARTDIFSLGVVLYELISKQPLFAGETTADVIAAIINKEPEPLSDFAPDTPEELERIVRKALAKDARDRYQTARDLQIDLQNLKQESEVSARLNRSGQSQRNSQTDSSSRKPLSQVTRQLAAPRVTLKQILLAIPVLILLGGAIWWFAFKRSGRVDVPPLPSLKHSEVARWLSEPGEIYSSGAFSPDAKWIAFSSTMGGGKNIWVKQTASTQDHQSTNDSFRNDQPLWAPDQLEIAYFSLKEGKPGIWRMPQLGGPATRIKELSVGEGDVKLKSWSKNGATLYYESKQTLFALDVKSGQIKPLTNPASATIVQGTLSISPDEQTVAYAMADSGRNHSLWVVPVAGGSAKQIAKDFADARNLVWHSDNKRILFSANVDGTFQIFVADVYGHLPVQITFGDNDNLILDVSADGSKLLYGTSKEESDVWGVNLATGEEFALAADLEAELWPDVAKDGKKVAYQAIKNLSQGNKINRGVILSKVYGSKEAPFQLADEGFLPKWSPDGKRLAYLRRVDKATNLWAMDGAGGGITQLTKNGLISVDYSLLPYNRSQTSSFDWAPDGSRIVYYADRAGSRNFWIVSANGTSDKQVTNLADPNLVVACPLWSPNGQLIAFSAKPNKANEQGRTDFSAWLIEPDKQTSRKFFQADSSRYRLLGWAANGHEVYVAQFVGATAGQPQEIHLYRVSTETGAQNKVATLPMTYFYNVYLSSDKQKIAFVSHQGGNDNVWVMPVTGGVARKVTSNNDQRLFFSTLAWSPDGQAIYFGKQSRYSLLSTITNFQ